MKRNPPEPSAVVASIPAAILADPMLSAGAKILFGCIYSLSLAHERCFVSNTTLAKRMGVKHPNSIRRLLGQLQRRKLIERAYDEDHHRNEIKVTWQPGKIVVEKRRARALTPRTDALGGESACARGGERMRSGAATLRAISDGQTEPNQPSAAREGAAAGGVAVWDLLGRAEELGLKGIAESKVADAVAVFGDLAVAKALDEAERHAATSWGYVLTVLRRWKAEDALPKAKAKPKPQPAPPPSTVFQPPPDDRPLEPGEARAMMAKLKRQLAEGAKP